MNVTMIKGLLCWVLMIVFIIMTFITKDVINSEFFACLGVAMAILSLKMLSTPKEITNEQ
jgi:hypothetical protein